MGARPSWWMSIVLLLLILIQTAGLARAQALGASLTSTAHSAAMTPEGPIWTFTEGEYAFSGADAIPASGWTRGPVPMFWQFDHKRSLVGTVNTVWVRFRFDRAAFGSGALALTTESNRERVTIYLNGMERYRNFSSPDQHVLGWNHPYRVPLPADALRPGTNEIVIRAQSEAPFNLSVGSLRLGPDRIISAMNDRLHFNRITAPLAANAAMLFLALCALLMWAKRRQDHELPMLALTGIFWFIRNMHFFAETAFATPVVFVDVTYYSFFFAVAASLSFCLVFLKAEHAWRSVCVIFGLFTALCLIRAAMHRDYPTDLLVTSAIVIIAFFIVFQIMQLWAKARGADHLMLVIVLFGATILSVHDYGRIHVIHWWDGLGFFVQPFLGALMFAVFLFSVGRRYLASLRMIEDMNVTLETGIASAREELALSEAARRKLEVASAVERERERMMLEIHDGIGSNLVNALAVARKQNQPQQTINTLRRTLADLKIAVDSLDPVDGDLVALLASLRHRIEPDLRAAGVKSLWRVEECPRLDWLDPVNALHILRTLQEAISNALSHANARTLGIECAPATLGGKDGVVVAIFDDGSGIAKDLANDGGRGIANMRARAGSLGGQLVFSGAPGAGTRVELWLPLERRSIKRFDA